MTEPAKILWTAGFLNERFPAPVSPLGWSVVGPQFEEYALRDPLRFMGYPDADRIAGTRLVHGHPYANVLIFQILYNPFPDAFLSPDAVRYFPEGAVSMRMRSPYPRSVLNPRFLLSMLYHFLRDPINWSPLNYWQWRRHTRLHDERVAGLNARLDQSPAPPDILKVLVGARQADADFLKIHRWSLTYADLFFKWLGGLVGDSAQSLIADVPNLTRQVNQDLEALALLASRLQLRLDSDRDIAEARSHPEFEREVQRFLVQHGHRSFSLDIEQPTFREDPLAFLKLLAIPPPPVRQRGEGDSIALTTRSRLPLYKRAVFDTLLAFARRYATLREDQRYYWQKSLAVSRRAYLMIGANLQAQKLISSPEDIFYATADEVTSLLRSQLSGSVLETVLRERQREWVRYRSDFSESPERAYPAFLLGDTPLISESGAHADSWQGRGISPGQARGKARVILNARDLYRVSRGDILIAPATDPGWTAVFSRLSALVVERGGILAHSAIVAREHRLPAVAGISNITQLLADGDWIEVDGTLGTVRKIKE